GCGERHARATLAETGEHLLVKEAVLGVVLVDDDLALEGRGHRAGSADAVLVVSRHADEAHACVGDPRGAEVESRNRWSILAVAAADSGARRALGDRAARRAGLGGDAFAAVHRTGARRSTGSRTGTHRQRGLFVFSERAGTPGGD